MRKRTAVVLAGCALFCIGHRLHSSEEGSPAPKTTRPYTAHAHDAPGTARATLSETLRDWKSAADAPQSQLEREASNTIHESDAHREARRAYLSREIERLNPSLPPAKRNQMLALNDRNEAEFRQYRAGFMLGDLTEDEYVAGLKEMVRRGVEESKGFLTRDEFVVLEGNPDYDPFDARAHSVPGGPKYLSSDEAAALKNNEATAASGPPDKSAGSPL